MKNDTPRTDDHGEYWLAPGLREEHEIVPADFARELERENAILLDALCDMVAVAEAQGWDNAEIHNAREALAGLTQKN
jgi:hypothetical protein